MSAPDAHVVARELDRLLGSPSFKGSKRSQEFLRHVVDAALREESETLKERTIGVALFHRPADYDTSVDAIVRVKANEVRRRLAQAYQELGPAPEVEIALPPGSYVPEFRPAVEALAGDSPEGGAGTRGRVKALWAAAALLALAGVAATAVWLRSNDPARQFWKPFLAAESPTQICVSQGTEDGQGAADFVSVGEMRAAARLAAHFAKADKPYRILTGRGAAFQEDHRLPAVFLGSLARQLAIQGNERLRYVFRGGDGVAWIEDTAGKGRRWTLPDSPSSADYAIVTRLLDARTGRPVILAAGLGPAGTQAAGELLANDDAVNSLLRKLEAGWPLKNLQMVLRVEVRGAQPAAPELVAAHVW